MLKRRVGSDGIVELGIHYQKNLPQHVQYVRGTIRCRADALASPVSWRFSSETRRGGGAVLPRTPLEKSGKIAEERIVIAEEGKTRQITLGPDIAVNWALFDAVQRLKRETFEPIRFTMLDHFDQVKAGQVLSYRGAIEVAFGGGTIRLHGFDELGEGIVPWVYWVDEQGRLLFAVSGIEGYIRVMIRDY